MNASRDLRCFPFWFIRPKRNAPPRTEPVEMLTAVVMADITPTYFSANTPSHQATTKRYIHRWQILSPLPQLLTRRLRLLTSLPALTHLRVLESAVVLQSSRPPSPPNQNSRKRHSPPSSRRTCSRELRVYLMNNGRERNKQPDSIARIRLLKPSGIYWNRSRVV